MFRQAVIVSAAILSTCAAQAARAEPCELHVWPSNRLSGATMGSWAPGLVPALMAGKTGAQIAVLTTLLDPPHQREELQKFGLPTALGLPTETVVTYHDAPSEPGYERGRNLASQSRCYAEFYVGEIIFNRHPLYGKDILAFFTFRQFGEGDTIIAKRFDRVRTKMADFPSRVESDPASIAAVSDMVRKAFITDVSIFAGRVRPSPRRQP